MVRCFATPDTVFDSEVSFPAPSGAPGPFGLPISWSKSGRRALWCICLGLLLVLGCGGSGVPAPKGEPTRKNLEKIGAAYAKATLHPSLAHPPQNLNELMPFLKAQGDPDQLLRSPNDDEMFVIVWGAEIRFLKAKGSALPVLAYEKQGKNGLRHVLRGSSEVVLLTESELKASVFPPGQGP